MVSAEIYKRSLNNGEILMLSLTPDQTSRRSVFSHQGGVLDMKTDLASVFPLFHDWVGKTS